MTQVFSTRMQLAGLMVDASEKLPGPFLRIVGSAGDWSIKLVGAYDGLDPWLASTREPGTMRTFKTLDAAHAECLQIYAAAGIAHSVDVLSA